MHHASMKCWLSSAYHYRRLRTIKDQILILVTHYMICLKFRKKQFSEFIANLQIDGQNRNHLTVSSEKPIMLNSLNSISWLIVSNAFWRSIKIIPVSKMSSKPFKILSFKNERHVSVECFSLKLGWWSCKTLLRLTNSFVWSRTTFSETLDKKGSRNIGLRFDGSVFELVLKSYLTFGSL